MKKTVFIISSFLLSATGLMAQEYYMDKVVEQACSCVSELSEPEDINELNLGLCIIQEAVKYTDEIKRDYGIDMANIDQEGEELGRIVGMKMLNTCPEEITRIVNATYEEGDSSASEDSVTGEIKAVGQGDFIFFSLTDADGRTSKFYWLTFVESDYDLQNNYQQLIGRRVNIDYTVYELYDRNLGEYRNYNLIDTISVLD